MLDSVHDPSARGLLDHGLIICMLWGLTVDVTLGALTLMGLAETLRTSKTRRRMGRFNNVPQD